MSYSVKPYHWYRKLVHDATRIGLKKPYIKVFGDAEITVARKLIKEYNRNRNDNISLTSYLIYCLAKTLKDYPKMQSYKSWNNKVYTFYDVDILIPVQLIIDGEKFLTPFILKNAEQKNCSQIQEKLRIASEKTEFNIDRTQKLFLKLPWFIRKLIYKVLFSSPLQLKKRIGTISFSPSHMFSKVKAYGLGAPSHTTGIYTAGMFKEDAKTKVCISIIADHDFVDGAYLAQFGSALCERIKLGEIE